MRKLTVKNFSVIKEAELEFGKITVLIGPQASGKSLLCKLAHFFAQIVPYIVERFYIDRLSYASLVHRVWLEFIDRFPEDSWSGQEFQINYQINYRVHPYAIKASKTATKEMFKLDFGMKFEEWYSLGTTTFNSEVPSRIFNPSPIRMKMDIDGVDTGPLPIVENSIFIPAGRAFFSTPNKGFAALSIKNLDWFTQAYATELNNEYRALREAYNSGLTIRFEFGESATRILKGKVVMHEGRLMFESIDDGRRRPFEILSSGTLELLPLVNTLSQLVQRSRYPDIPTMPVPPFGVVYIEEPESGVFPSTQNDLAKLFAWLASQDALWMQYAITTHSPYILTSFNNLIYSGQLAKEKPELKDEIAKLVPEHFWIEDGSFRAYCIQDGVLKSILSESGLIDGEYLDSVSETIGNEFDSLLRLEYDHTAAS